MDGKGDTGVAQCTGLNTEQKPGLCPEWGGSWGCVVGMAAEEGLWLHGAHRKQITGPGQRPKGRAKSHGNLAWVVGDGEGEV